MLVTRKKPPVSDAVLVTAAVPRFVSVISAPGTALPAGSTTIPRIELETVCATPTNVTNANRAHNRASLEAYMAGPPHWGANISDGFFECKRLQRMLQTGFRVCLSSSLERFH